MADIIISVLLSVSLIGAYAMLAVGIVSIYRASKVLNLAHGAMAMIPAYVTFTAVNAGFPKLIAMLIGVASGGATGYLVERVFVRPLRKESPTSQTVGTVAAFGLLLAVSIRIWGTTPQRAVQIFSEGTFDVAGSPIRYGEIGLFFVMLVVAGVLFAVFKYTDLGLIMRGTAENRRAASLMGVDPQRVTNIAWVLGGSLAGLAGILLAAITSLSPFVLSLQALPAFVAALIGGLGSFPGAVVGGTAVGLAAGFVPQLPLIGRMEGAPQFVLALIAVAAMAWRGGGGLAGSDVRGDQ